MTTTNKEGGFVLVEAIAALAVAALAATALMAALGAASARSAEAEIRLAALRQAEALMAETVAALAPDQLETRGILPVARLSWTRTVKDVGESYPGFQHVVVEVGWTNLQKKGATRLEAYRIAPRS